MIKTAQINVAQFDRELTKFSSMVAIALFFQRKSFKKLNMYPLYH
jgi:hypothetical protein